ncbi:hypothetical protein [Paraburkholderia sp. SIMBA_054]|uniref:hypothetical protein n=1 Tax=Paraburkholderia sp. SIMBA_054 TaxID=3085795 RepID=UPI0039796DA9
MVTPNLFVKLKLAVDVASIVVAQPGESDLLAAAPCNATVANVSRSAGRHISEKHSEPQRECTNDFGVPRLALAHC